MPLISNPLLAATSFRERNQQGNGSMTSTTKPPLRKAASHLSSRTIDGKENESVFGLPSSSKPSAASQWHELPCSGDIPIGRSHSATAVVGDFLYLVGGSRISATRALSSARKAALASSPSSRSLLDPTPSTQPLPPLARRSPSPSPFGEATAPAPTPPLSTTGSSSAAAAPRASSIAAGQPPLADMYRLNLRTGVWERIHAKNIPRVSHHSLTAASGALWLIGGWDGSRRSARVFRFDLEEHEGWEEVQAKGYLPCGLSSHTATKLDERHVFIVGREGGHRTQRRWTSYFQFDCVTCTWTELPSTVASRSGHSAAILRSGRLFIYGGRRSADFDIQPVPVAGMPSVEGAGGVTATLRTRLGAVPCKAPLGRTHQASWSIGSLLIVHGGQLLDLGVSINKNLEDQMFAFDAESSQWLWVPGGSGVVRTGHMGEVWARGRKLVMVSGEDYAGHSNKVLVLDL